MQNNNNKIIGLQYLRAIAALMVAYFHLIGQVPAFTPALDFPYAQHFNRGVDLFFVISGFVMMVTGANANPVDFMRKRMVRIVPLYWLLTCALVALVLVKPAMFKSTHVTVSGFMHSLAFLPYPNHEGTFDPLLVPGWTLNYEMFFYVVFASVLLFCRSWLLCATSAVFALVWALCMLTDARGPLSFYGDPIIFEFLIGLAIGKYYRSIKMQWWSAAIYVTWGFALLIVPESRLIAMAGAGLIVLGTCSQECRLPNLRALSFLGDASYSLYLWHIFVFGALRLVWKGGPIGFAIASIAAVIAVSIFSYLWLEKSFLRLGRRWPAPMPQSQAVGSI